MSEPVLRFIAGNKEVIASQNGDLVTYWDYDRLQQEHQRLEALVRELEAERRIK